MSFAKAYSGMKGAAGRALILGVCALGLAGCDTLSSLNPFDKSETYKPEIVANAPAEEIYNDGLARVQKGDFERRGEEVQRPRQAISLFRMVPQRR